MEMLRRLDIDRQFIHVQRLHVPQKSRRQPILLPPMRGVVHHRHGQVHLARMRLGRRRDGIKPRRNLVRQGQKFLRRERHRIFDQHIRVIAREDIIVERLIVPHDFPQLPLGLAFRQTLQHRFHELLAHPVQRVLLNEHIPQRQRPRRQLDRRLPARSQVRQQIIHHRLGIPRNHPQRIARRIGDPACPEMHHDMPRLLVRALRRQRIIRRDPGLERVRAIVKQRE